MTDTGRQSATDKIGAAIKPDSQKPLTEKVGDYAKGKGDSLLGGVQPEESKTFTQQVTDAISGAGSTAGDVANSVTGTIGGMLGGAQNTANNVANDASKKAEQEKNKTTH